MTNALVKPGYYVTVNTICKPLSRITSLFEPNFNYYKNYTFFSNTKHVFTVSIIYRLLKCSFNEISNHHRTYNSIKSHIIVTCLFFNGYQGYEFVELHICYPYTPSWRGHGQLLLYYYYYNTCYTFNMHNKHKIVEAHPSPHNTNSHSDTICAVMV